MQWNTVFSRAAYWAAGKFIGLVVLTVLAIAVMWAIGTGNWSPESAKEVKGAVDASPASVIVSTFHAQPVEIIDTYSGMLQPLERFTVGFEIAGRLEALGLNASGQPLDEGDYIVTELASNTTSESTTQPVARYLTSQVLARLDSEILRTQLAETKVQREKADYDYRKQYQLWKRKTITDAEYQNYRTTYAVATARWQMARRRYQDAQLRLIVPVVTAVNNGSEKPRRRFKISKKLANAGETVSSHQPIFELIEVDQVKLVVGIPESRIRELDLRYRDVVDRRRRKAKGENIDPRLLDVHAKVELVGRDKFGKPWMPLDGKVLQIAETADDRTGLFDVEIVMDNADGTLRPGQIALAHIILSEIRAYRLPLSSAVFRDGRAFVYAATGVMGGESQSPPKARQVELDRWIEQGAHLIVPQLPDGLRTIVVRGQHRLTDGRPLEVMATKSDSEAIVDSPDRDADVRIPKVGAKPD